MSDERPLGEASYPTMVQRDRLKRLRKEAGLTVRQLAERLGQGVHFTTVSKIENGKMGLTMPWAERFATALSISPARLLGYEELGEQLKEAPLLQIPEVEDYLADPESYYGVTVTVQTNRNNIIALPRGVDNLWSTQLDRGFFCVDLDDRTLEDGKAFYTRQDFGRFQIGTYHESPPHLALWQTDHKQLVFGERPFTLIGRVFYIGQYL